MTESRVIGKENQLPWHISEDLKRFKELTIGYPIIMGRKTFESLGRPLPNRTNIIITRDVNKALMFEDECGLPGEDVVASLDEAVLRAQIVLNVIEKNEHKNDKNEIFVIGGGQIFEQAIKIADKLYLTIVHKEVDGDVYFPDYSDFKKEIYRKDSSSGDFTYTFLTLTR